MAMRKALMNGKSLKANENRPPGHRVVVAGVDATSCTELAGALRDEGFVVAELGSALHVLKALGGRTRDRSPIDLLVLDVSDRHLVGTRLLEAVRGEDWSLPIVVITDRASPPLKADFHRLEALAVFEKPVDTSRVAHTLRTALASSEPTVACAS